MDNAAPVYSVAPTARETSRILDRVLRRDARQFQAAETSGDAMRTALIALGCLEDEDVDWLAEAGTVQALQSKSRLIQKGVTLPALYIVLTGQLSVRAEEDSNSELNRLLPGDVVGELSFLDSRPPTASVFSVSESSVLATSRVDVEAKLRSDKAFAARFYRALGVFLASRLRRQTLIAASPRQGLPLLDPDHEDPDELAPEVLEASSLGAQRFRYLLTRSLPPR